MGLNVRRRLIGALQGVVIAGCVLAGAATATAQNRLGPAAPPSYDNKFEVYGGLNFMNFQGGQALPKRMNLGGGEAMGTYYVTRKLGVGADYRWDAGTTPVIANPYVKNRPLVMLNTIMGGVQYRGPKNHYAAIDYHAFFGVSHGDFTYSTGNVLQQYGPNAVAATGLYTNRTKPVGAFGGSVDFNRSRNMAIRIQPDLIYEHFGTESRLFFSISGGVVWRLGRKR
ncbi:MAG TPA: hypothetical protein VGC07_08165 [Granulicella sp.]